MCSGTRRRTQGVGVSCRQLTPAPDSDSGTPTRGAVPRHLLVAALLSLSAQLVIAQTPALATPDSLTGRLSGTVRDSIGTPVVGASIVITPGGAILRTDDSGSFALTRSPVGRIQLKVRRLGFFPVDTQAVIAVGSDNVVNVVMQRLTHQLEAVVITAERRQCERFSLDGVLCRREVGNGRFIGYEQILAKKPVFIADIFRDEPGFRIGVNKYGRTYASIEDWRCVMQIVDGDEIKRTNPLPRPQDVFAVEIYQRGEYPPEYWHWAWRGRYPCTLVVFWTKRVLSKGLRR